MKHVGSKPIHRLSGRGPTSSRTGSGLPSCALVLAGALSCSGLVRAQNTTPDAQVEANVLKAMASAPDLAGQSISTRTVYGVVTLSGVVPTEAVRVKADNLAANADGVQKVVDELQVQPGTPVATTPRGSTPPAVLSPSAGQSTPGAVLQSDGTYAPAAAADSAQQAAPVPGSSPASTAVMNDPEHDQAQYAQQGNGSSAGGQDSAQPLAPPSPYGPPSPPRSPGSQPLAPPSPYGEPSSGSSGGTSHAAPIYPAPRQAYPPPNRNAAYPPPQGGVPQPWGGQLPGQPVVIPAGALVRVRVAHLLASDSLQPGDAFDGFVANDVVAGGLVAIPRGAAVQGKVMDARPSGAVAGRGQLSVQLTSVTLAGKIFPLVSDTWSQSGPSKTGQTAGHAAGLGVAGAFIGAIAGGGAGALVGAGVGAAAGVGVSAAQGRGQVVVPPEGMLTFHLAQQAAVTTVSEQEMQRLAYSAPAGRPEMPPRQPLYIRPYPVYGYPPPPPYPYPVY